MSLPILWPFTGLLGSAVSGITGGITVCCTTQTAAALCKSYNCQSSVATRIGYSVLLLVNSLLAWSMLTPWLARLVAKYTYEYIQLECTEGKCFGVLAVHRVCLSLTLLHVLLGLLMIGVESGNDRRADIQNGWWGPKVFVWALLNVLTFSIPNGFFIWYSKYLAAYGAGLFVLVGLVLLVDFAHTWSERCLINYEDTDSNNWVYILVGSTAGLMVVSVIIDIVSYVWRPDSWSAYVLALHVLLSALAVYASIDARVQDANPRSGIAQASMVVAYTAYLIASAVLGRSEERCSDGGAPFSMVLLGAFFTTAAVAYSTSRAATRSSSIMLPERDEELPVVAEDPSSKQLRDQAILAAIAAGSLPASAYDEMRTPLPADDEISHTQYNYAYFHAIFVLATMYVAMLLTDWTILIPDTDAPSHNAPVMIGCSKTAMWVKLLSAVACFTLYIWSLLAPVISPERF